MDDIRAQCHELKEGWPQVYEAIKATPSLYSAHLPFSTPEQLNEVVETVCFWLDRTKAPTGFSPGFHLAKGLLATSLAATLISLKALQKAEYNHFQSFVLGLNQVLSALHTAVVFSTRPEAGEALADLGAGLSQSMALMDTAQRELKEKLDLLKEAEAAIQKTRASAQVIDALKPRAESALETINAANENAAKKLQEMTAHQDEVAIVKAEVKNLLKQSSEAQSKLHEQQKTLSALHEKSLAQQKLISDLLPKGASAALASGFADRGARLEFGKWMWMLTFIVSIGGLLWTAYQVVPHAGSTKDIWEHLLYRLPLAAPLVWLGWFSAIQYGNTIRVQEDYAFKEATSKAFAGYKDHMEHMASVQLDEAKTAMTLLAERTIEILAREPLRIYQGSERDATPTPGFFDALLRRGKAEEKSGPNK